MRKKYFTILVLLLVSATAWAETIKGVIKDAKTGETLIGASVLVVGTQIGTSTDIDGNYEITGLGKGKYKLEVRYIFYKTTQSNEITLDGDDYILDFSLEPEENELDEVFISAKVNRENETALLSERKAAPAAIENIGAKEMSSKGISNVEEGVKKISGISFEESGQLLVRGLGDRYSTTTLNGLPIASPNPDKKLIPLDLFSTSTIESITVSKTYLASAYADYSGAHIDIGTKESSIGNICSISASLGGMIGTTFKDFYQSDKRWGLWKSNNLSSTMKALSGEAFSDYIKKADPFHTTFSIPKSTALPSGDLSALYSHLWKVGSKGNAIDLTASLSLSNQYESIKEAYISNLTAQGDTLNEFTYDGYTRKLDIAGLINVGYDFNVNDNISYTLFYARNATDNYKLREGYDSEGVHLIGSNSVAHEYALLTNQLTGFHTFNPKWNLDWGASFGLTKSNEPDRRQVMFREDYGRVSLFKLNQQETMRYFGELNEKEAVANVNTQYRYWNESSLRFGVAYKNKYRDFRSIRYYYGLNHIDPEITDVFNTDSFLNQENIANGNITITKDAQPKSQYFAGNSVMSGFAETDLKPLDALLINLGVRYEYATQWVRYWNDASIEKRSNLTGGDLFPALNVRYNVNKRNTLRLAASRTVTRPSFIEMAPFLYKESYGSTEIRGNEDICNGYNYNFDLRYELTFSNPRDLLSLTAYYKILQNPIEQVQESSGGSAVYTFRNADSGNAMGIELECKKMILPVLRFTCNASFIFTSVMLPEDGGIYTESERALQGASPYLVNADIAYVQPFQEDSELSMTLLYNLQGPRIYAVGIYGMGNVMQKPLHTLDFSTIYKMNNHWSLSLQATNLLGSTMRFTQEVKEMAKSIEVQRYNIGTEIKVGATFKF